LMSGAPASSFTVAVPALTVGEVLSPRVLGVIEKTIRYLTDMGVHIVRVPMPDLDQLGKLASVILSVEASSYHRSLLSRTPERYGRQVLRRLTRGLLLHATDYHDAIRLHEPVLKRFVSENLHGAHALLLPTLPDLPPLVEDTVNHDQNFLEHQFSVFSWWTRGINYLGVPALSMPIHISDTELLSSIQLVGHPYGETQILRLAYFIEQENLADR